VNGDGTRRTREDGKYAGQHYQKPHKRVGNLHVAVRRAAEGNASAIRLLCSALLSVTAVDFALTDNF